MKKNDIALLALVRKGIGQTKGCKIPEGTDWQRIMKLAIRHDVIGLVTDGILRCFDEGIPLDIDRQTKMKFVGLTSRLEQRYEQQLETMKSLANFYQQHGIRMMVLKGYGLSQNYPIPNHRVSSDIDIYLYGEQKRADQLVQKELGIKIDNGHLHHTVFNYKRDTIENHYDFISVHVHRSSKRVEKRLKELSTKGQIETENFFLPSADFNAIFILRHCITNFASTRMFIRQVLDWGFFMKKHHQEINWEEYMSYLKKEGMDRFYNLIGMFCVKYLGFEPDIFHGLHDDDIFDRFANEVMTPEFKDKENGKLLHSLSVKPRRWWHNRWKNQLCYPDSMLSHFIYGLWSKILKPSHFYQ